MITKTIEFYNKNAKKFEVQYFSTTTREVHSSWLNSFLPKVGLVLDVGAGVGRDAQFFAERGLEVIAVEPSENLMHLGKKHTEYLSVNWMKDHLPKLKTIQKLNQKFDLILLSAVWMHIPINKREISFKSLISLLAKDGKLVISLRHGSNPDEREMFPVSVDEITELAIKNDASVCHVESIGDTLNRNDVLWETVVLKINPNKT